MSILLKVSPKSFLFLIVLCLFQITRADKLFREDKIKNKPSIKIMKIKHEDVYECVDFYKQPAFDHPNLKMHTFHPKMRPSTSTNSKYTCKMNDNLMLKDGECPFGSVPIRRVSKDEIDIINNFTQNYAKPNAQPLPGTHFAILETDTNTVKYIGIGGSFSIYNYSLDQPQYSSGVLIVQNGEDRIKVGWTDATNGHWWLSVCDVIIGFWPKQIFTTLSNSATYMAVGGEAIIDRPELRKYVDDPQYGIIDVGDTSIYGHLILYGGPNK